MSFSWFCQVQTAWDSTKMALDLEKSQEPIQRVVGLKATTVSAAVIKVSLAHTARTGCTSTTMIVPIFDLRPRTIEAVGQITQPHLPSSSSCQLIRRKFEGVALLEAKIRRGCLVDIYLSSLSFGTTPPSKTLTEFLESRGFFLQTW